jgi:uncharacterized protein (TIRG00374 family)
MSAALLYLVSLNVDAAQVVENLASINTTLLAPAAIATICSVLIKTERLRLLLDHSPQNVIPFQKTYIGLSLGIFGNVFLPLRGGDALRCVALSKLVPGSSVSRQIGVFVAEKTFETVSFALIAVFGVIWFHRDFLDKTPWAAALAMGVLAIGIIGLFAMNWLLHHMLPERLEKLRVIIWGKAVLQNISAAFRDIASLRQISVLAGLTIALRLIEATMFLLIAQGLGMTLSIPQLAVIFAISAFGIAIPAAPGFVGTFEAAIVYATMMFGIDQTAALGFALTAHAWLLLSWLLMGATAFALMPGIFTLVKKNEKMPCV